MANTELIEFLPNTCSPQPIPHTYGCIGTRDTQTIPSTYGFNLSADFGTTNATDTYFHVIANDNLGIDYFYPPATTTPTTPIVCTNVAAIQAFLNSINSGITYNVNAFNEIVLTFANPGDESIWRFWLGNSAPDGYTNKLTPTLHDLQVDTQTYQQVQVVKSQQADGTFIDKFFIPSGDTLVEVSLKPENTFKFGNCPDCKKEIFATHDRYIVVPAIPPNSVAYELTTNLPTQSVDATNSYFHLIYPVLNGSTLNPIGAQLTEYFSNPQSGILWTDITGVQAVIDFVLPSMVLQVGDIVYAINTDNLPIFFLSPDAVTALANSTYLHVYWGIDPTHNNYNEKADVSVIASNSNVLLGGDDKCVGIQEIKEKDTCTGEETYRYVIEDQNGLLVPVTDVYPDFVESDVLLECPKITKTVNIPNCDSTSTPTEVDEVSGVYVLNQDKFHTERVYDNVTATLTGSFNAVIVGTNLSFDFTNIVPTNWVGANYLVDFGNGYTDTGGNPTFNYSNEPDGKYEIKVFRGFVFPEGVRYYLLHAVEIQKTGSTLTLIGANPQTVNRSITYTTKEVFQNYCDSTPVGSPYVANGTAATLLGTLSQTYREELSEWLGVTDANNPSGGGTTPTVVIPTYSTNRTLQTINTTPAAYNVSTIANSREITVQNLTNADVQITTSQGTQIVATRGVITLSNPNNTTVNQAVFTGNITVTFLSSVGGNIGGVAPRVIINQKATI